MPWDVLGWGGEDSQGYGTSYIKLLVLHELILFAFSKNTGLD